MDEGYRRFARAYLLSFLTNVTAADKANRLIGNFLIERGQSLNMQKHDEKTYCCVQYEERMHQHFGTLMTTINRLLISGNQDNIDRFVQKYSGDNQEITEELVKRTQRTNFFRESAFKTPFTELHSNPMGGIKEVTLEQPRDFASEMLQFSG